MPDVVVSPAPTIPSTQPARAELLRHIDRALGDEREGSVVVMPAHTMRTLRRRLVEDGIEIEQSRYIDALPNFEGQPQ